ncbi:1286_t:CDS:2 [Paraglomus brasilianum]|uniref:1286_t:CDS:1 n=1 Tax=Paraglomus brasilianum TaxID=144538 RepID=A0A9N9F9J3_9GLOM|nr:1286_t:CDS:2 [Paraglomus brasilianum]
MADSITKMLEESGDPRGPLSALNPFTTADLLNSVDTSLLSNAVDIKHDGNEWKAIVKLPGVPKEAVNTRVEGNNLHISADIEHSILAGGPDITVESNQTKKFSHSVVIPPQYNADKLETRFENDTTIITIPKT